MSFLLDLLTDEDVHGQIIDGLRRHCPGLDLVRAVDVGLGGFDDDDVLTWAAQHGRVLVTHDVNTCVNAAKARVSAGLPMAGLVVVPQSLAVGKAIAELRYVAEVCTKDEMAGAILWLPL